MTETKRPRGRPPKNKEVEKPHMDAFHADASGWRNAMSGLGMQQDKSVYTHYGSARILNEKELTQLYLAEGLGYRIISVIPQDATREWVYVWDDKSRAILDREFERLGAEEAFYNALVFQRTYGGSLIIIGAMDGNTIDKPLNLKGIRSIEYIKAVDNTCVNISESEWDMNPSSPMFGKIIKYKVRYYINDRYVDQMIHHSRVIEFKGDPVPTSTFSGVDRKTRYWGMSALQPVYNALSALGSVTQNTLNILLSFNTGTYKFKNLGALLSSGQEELLSKRLQAIETSSSTMNARVIDSEESYQKEYTSLAGIDQLIGIYMLQLSGVSSIPMTRLFGKSPSGFSTGDADIENYYNFVEAYQKNRLKRPVHLFLNMLCSLHKLPLDPDFEFNSLYQMNETQKAELARIEAETEKTIATTELMYINAGLRDPLAVAKKHGWEEEYDDIIPPEIPEVDDDPAST